MAKELYNTPYDKPACPTPSGDTATLAGEKGGYTGWGLGDSGSMPKETANMSELGLALNTTLDVKDGPAPWSQVAVEPGVASPAVPAASIQKIT